MIIDLKTLSLIRFDEQKHGYLIKEFKNGSSYSNYIYDVAERLQMSKLNNNSIYQSAFVVVYNNISIGYLYISSKVNDEIFLEYSVLKEFRKMGYGSRLVNEMTDYLFQNYNIRSIRLDIDQSNKNSVFLANSCGFIFDEDEYESRNYIGKMQFVKENDYYISRRRKK